MHLNEVMGIWQYLLLIFSVLLGGGLSFLAGRDRWIQFLPVLLSFSGAYLLGVVGLELIPEIFGYDVGEPGLFLLLGFFVQLLLENLSQGVEHGHVHAHRNAPFRYGFQIMLGLCVHAFLEGLPLASGEEAHAHGHTHASSEHLLFGILLHKLPAAFALGLLLRASDYSLYFRIIALLIFASMSPLGAILGHELLFSATWHHNIMALVIGSFLHISTTILFEADSGAAHRISSRKLLVIVIGMGLAYVSAH
ncbi:MAG: ZIP family metal transporter [Bacteroidota bacterium]